jgi:hypothetical protein
MQRAASILGAVLLVACSPQPSSSVSSVSSPILNGSDDSPELYPGVVRLTTGVEYCSGTLIAAAGTTGWVLTAAHCLMPGFAIPGAIPASDYVMQVGADVATAASFPVAAGYVPADLDLDRTSFPENLDVWPIARVTDVALLEVTGLTPEVAALATPWLDPAEDTLAAGSTGDIAGYGRLVPAGSPATVRQRATVDIYGVYPSFRRQSDFIVLDQRGSAPGFCLGDSGGPLLVASGTGDPAVAGVISSTASVGYSRCLGFGLLARLSQVVADFIEPVLAGTPPAPTACYACAYQATLPGGECVDELAAANASATDFVDCLGSDAIDSCRTTYPDGAAAYDAYWSCLETVACAGLCSDAYRNYAECEIALDGAGPCDACLHESCCATTAECSHDTDCHPCINDLSTDPAACAASPLYQAVHSCLADNCADECGTLLDPLPPVADAGPPDADAAPDADVAPDAAAPPEAASESGGDDGGCGCHAAGGRAPSGALALLGGALGLVGRRPRATTKARTRAASAPCARHRLS